jgi:Ser/Thr protein kinase RdoA (MazF antagonist)
MAAGPAEAALDWVAGTLGTGWPEVVCGLRDGASPWSLRAGCREVVLRVGRPARDRPIGAEDFAALRRRQPPQELLAAAEEAVARGAGPCERPVLVHGDLWQGNALWQGTTVTGLIDWDCAGAGDPGVDLGSLRCDAAFCYGPQAPDHVLRGWEEEAGRSADRVAYWDLVAALSSPPDMGGFPLSMALQGRPDLDRPTMLARRDEFLRQALEALN